MAKPGTPRRSLRNGVQHFGAARVQEVMRCPNGSVQSAINLESSDTNSGSDTCKTGSELLVSWALWRSLRIWGSIPVRQVLRLPCQAYPQPRSRRQAAMRSLLAWPGHHSRSLDHRLRLHLPRTIHPRVHQHAPTEQSRLRRDRGPHRSSQWHRALHRQAQRPIRKSRQQAALRLRPHR